MEYVQLVLEHPAEFVTFVFAFLGVFSVVAKFTPNTVDDRVLNAIVKVVNVLGLTKRI